MSFKPENIFLITLSDRTIGRHLNNKGIFPPLGLFSIYSFLHEKGVEMPFENLLDGEVVSNCKIEKRLSNVNEPCLIGFYTNISNYSETIEATKNIKAKLHENATIIYGGPFASSCPEEILSANPYIDYVGVGDGEVIFYALATNTINVTSLNGLFKRKSTLNLEIPQKRISHLGIGILPPPYQSIPDIDAYLKNSINKSSQKSTISYFHKNGCQIGCSFCSPFVQGRTGRSRSPRDAWEEYLTLNRKYGIDHLFEVSENIGINKNWYNLFADLSSKYNFQHELSFRFQVSPNFVDEEFVKKFVSIGGNTLAVGFESMDEVALAHAKNNKVSIENNINTFNLIRKYNINLVAFFVFGLPFETMKGINRTFEFIDTVVAYPKTTFLLATLVLPIPGTHIWKKYFFENKTLHNKYIKSNKFLSNELLWSPDEVTKDFINNCKDISIPYQRYKEIQQRIYNLKPEVFSSWHNEDF